MPLSKAVWRWKAACLDKLAIQGLVTRSCPGSKITLTLYTPGSMRGMRQVTVKPPVTNGEQLPPMQHEVIGHSPGNSNIPRSYANISTGSEGKKTISLAFLIHPLSRVPRNAETKLHVDGKKLDSLKKST